MTRKSASLQLMLPYRPEEMPAYGWLYSAIRDEILEGRLRPGARIPPTRELAEQYGFSRGTIVHAFEQLTAEGYLQGNVGGGTRVSEVLPDELLQVPKQRRSAEEAPHPQRRRTSSFAKSVRRFPMIEPRPARAFRANIPALDLFPVELWARLTARRFRRFSARLLMGCDALGYLPLREAIADYLRASRGVRCNAEQVVVLSGVQEALDLVTRLFVDRGDRVAMEDPGYPGATTVFEAAGAKITSLPLDEEGAVLRETSLRNARLAYLTPAHHFPTGATMTLPRRLEILEWARKSNALLFEDDYDSEYRYQGRPIPALQGLDRHGVVFFAGSFSKVLFPSLRLAYLVVPPDLVPLFEATRTITARHAPIIDQVVLCDFITEGHFGRHLRRMREIYSSRLTLLLERSVSELKGLLEISKVEAGLQTAGWLARGFTSDAACQAAAARGVEVTPISRYARRPLQRDGLILGFAAVDEREIRRGVEELATALSSLSRAHKRT